jgi:hypothetical protein
MVGAGIGLRLLLLLTAENRLDADESVVGLMALDILEGRSFPMFFYGGAYNGGGAWEAYLAVLPFAVFGPSALAVKLCVLALWSAAALLFADLCRRTLPTGQAMLTVSFFCIATPFFLEWSLKARGGFAEVVLFSVGLLWLAQPPRSLDPRVLLRSVLVGIVSGIGLWGSEMLLAMIPCAAGWLLLGCAPSRRGHASAALLAGFFIGSLPLLFFNSMHDWQHLEQSVVFSLLEPGGRAFRPHDLAQLRLSARFVLGPAWLLLLLGVAVSGVRLGVRRERWNLGHVALAHCAIFVAAYWLSGLRYLQIPPSRTLYALYPSLALLLGAAVYLPAPWGKTSRWVVASPWPSGSERLPFRQRAGWGRERRESTEAGGAAGRSPTVTVSIAASLAMACSVPTRTNG